jgi:hypothetical protein
VAFSDIAGVRDRKAKVPKAKATAKQPNLKRANGSVALVVNSCAPVKMGRRDTVESSKKKMGSSTATYMDRVLLSHVTASVNANADAARAAVAGVQLPPRLIAAPIPTAAIAAVPGTITDRAAR